MATLQDLPLQDLPELVRDSHLEATFHPNTDIPNETIHLKYQGRRRPQRERWVQKKMLGRGGFGIVWLERREPENSTAYSFRAVKQLDVAKIRSKRHDCVRELEALAKFSQEKYSEFFIKSYGWFQSPSALFLAMEYCELGDLKDHVEEHGRLAEDQVQDIGWQILQGLRFMHHNNFAHRDLKPANILIKNKPPYGDWHVKICDLGLSKRIETDAGTTTAQGAPGFMPPESVPGIGDNPRQIDPFPADMWCLGETIFYLLTRKRTFGGDLIRLRQYWKGDPFPKESLLRAKASDSAISFIQQLMARLPAQRLTAEMADQHELMKTEPFQEVEEETRGTSERREDPSTMIPEDPASGRWTTGASHQQGLRVPSDSWGSTIVEDVLPGQIPKSPRNVELAAYSTGASDSAQREYERGTDTSTLKADERISPSDQFIVHPQLYLELSEAFHHEAIDEPQNGLAGGSGPEPKYRPRWPDTAEELATSHHNAMDYKPQDSLKRSSSPEPPPGKVRYGFNSVIQGLEAIDLSSHESSRPSSTHAEYGCRTSGDDYPGRSRLYGRILSYFRERHGRVD